MKQIGHIGLAVLLAATPAWAESHSETAPEDGESVEEGFSLLEEGAKIILRGLMEEMEPALDDLGGLAENMGPAMRELRGMIGDITDYHMPEMLPNGDIIIRRKTPLTVPPPGVDGEIDL